MIPKKALSIIIVLGTATMLQSQRVGVDTTGSDTTLVHKIDSIAYDTYLTAKRVEKKAGRLVSLTQQARMQKALQSRIQINVSEIPNKELPVMVDSIKVDPPQVPIKHKFWFWRR